MRLITINLPIRYLVGLDEIVVRCFEANRAECIRWFVRDYLKQFDSDVWDTTLPKGRPRTQFCNFSIPNHMMVKLDRLVGSGYEVSRSRLFRSALRLYLAGKYKRYFGPAGQPHSAIFPIRTIDRSNELVKEKNYENGSQVIRSALDIYLKKVEFYEEMFYLSRTKLISLNLIPEQVKMLDWLSRQGYILNRNEGIIEAVNDGLLEMRDVLNRSTTF